MANVNPSQVQNLLFGMSYPAGKDQILSHAKITGADSTIVSLLNKLPNERYKTPSDIAQAIGNLN